MIIDFSIPMTFYELLAIILAAIAILIPIIQWIWKQWIRRPVLKYYPTGRGFLFCNRSGSYIRIEGTFEALRKSISIKHLDVKITREKDEKKLNLPWAIFLSPTNQSFVGNYATSTEIAHPFRIEADSMMCAFTEYSDMYDAAGKQIDPHITKLFDKAAGIRQSTSDYADAVAQYRALPEFAAAKASLEKEFYWEIGKYSATIVAHYGKKCKEFTYEFAVSEMDHSRLLANIDEVLISELKKYYGLPLAVQTVQVEIK